ncbi:hypothetical protein HMN09_00627600 [Mycena chlorophos]|uniref:Helicase C-terminal domain-containing protein n=1 Tax=Mycena chlorophos TaxID=658473 RepID=A0A8H6WC08_MYCCL|nr:hypothetical protein HMN09_00627600 [Mycena chlorophos]
MKPIASLKCVLPICFSFFCLNMNEWGMSFRPEYLKIARMVQESNVRRVLCLTATATPPVVEDMRRAFQIDESSVFQTPVYRPNLHLRVEAAETLYQKVDILVPLLKTRTGPAIVYVTLQKHTDDVASALEARGLKDVLRYHAGLPQDERKRIQASDCMPLLIHIHRYQDTFMAGQSYIVVATIAFGMGIDKADIRQESAFLLSTSTCPRRSKIILKKSAVRVVTACRRLVFCSCLRRLDIPALQGFCCGDTCAKRDVELWLHTVTSQAPASDGTLSFNLYEQSKLYDIRSNVLNLLYAQLELDFGYIRAVTPFYSIYEISPRDSTGRSTILNDQSTEAAHIRSFWRVKREKFEINVVDAAARINIDRSLLANKIMRWELDGHIQTRPSQVRARFLVLKPFPTAKEELAAITDEIYAGIAKLQEVIKFATEDDCLSSGLSVYFGGENTVPEDGCGTCTFCMKGQGVDFKPKTTDQVDEAKIAAILAACGERDDPRLLARMAFGITSPRLTALKCSTGHALFGSMGDCDFNALIAAFDAECAKVDYENQAIVVPSTSQKRTYSQTTGGRGGSGASKRARGGRGGRR